MSKELKNSSFEDSESEDTPETIASSPFLLKHQSGVDLGDRYENILQRQFDSLSNMENKAWKTIGAITSSIGLLLTGLSILVKFGGTNYKPSTLDVLPLVAGFLLLFGSIVYCIFVLVSTKARYGPSTKLGGELTDGTIDREYVDLMLENYNNSISENWSKLSEKSEYLRKAFLLLANGLLFSTVSLLFIILSQGETVFQYKASTLIVTSVLGASLGAYIWRRDFQSEE